MNQADLLGPLGGQVAAGEEELLGAGHADRIDEPLQAVCP